MFTTRFAKQLVERAVRTFAQTVVALAGAAQMDWLSLDWPHLLATAGVAAALSALTSVAAGPFGPSDDAGLV